MYRFCRIGSAAAAAVIADQKQRNNDDPNAAGIPTKEIAKAVHKGILLVTDS